MDGAGARAVHPDRARAPDPRKKRGHPHAGHCGAHRGAHGPRVQVRLPRRPRRRHHPFRPVPRRLADRVRHRFPGGGHHPHTPRSDPRPDDGGHHLGDRGGRHGVRSGPVVARGRGHRVALPDRPGDEPGHSAHHEARAGEQDGGRRPLLARPRDGGRAPAAGGRPRTRTARTAPRWPASSCPPRSHWRHRRWSPRWSIWRGCSASKSSRTTRSDTRPGSRPPAAPALEAARRLRPAPGQARPAPAAQASRASARRTVSVSAGMWRKPAVPPWAAVAASAA